MSADEAKEYFLCSDNFCNIGFPEYFSFEILLSSISQFLTDKNLADISSFSKLYEIDNANHKLIANKDGKYAWRPLEICNPVL